MARAAHNRWLRVGKIAAPVALAVLAIVFIDFRHVGKLLISADRGILALLLIAATLDRVLMALRWHLFLRAAEIEVPFRKVLDYYYQGSVVSFIPPTALGGDLLRAWLVKSRHGEATSSVLATIAMEKVLAAVSASALGIAGLGVLLGSLDSRLAGSLAGLVAAGTAVSVAVFVGSLYPPLYDRVYGLAQRIVPDRFHDSLDRLQRAYALINRRRGLLAWNLVATVAEHLVQFGMMYFVGRALGVDLPALTFIAAIALNIFVRRVSIYLDAWGLSEAASILLFRTVSIHQDMALSISLLLQAVLLVATLPPGLILLLRSGESVGRERREEIAAELDIQLPVDGDSASGGSIR